MLNGVLKPLEVCGQKSGSGGGDCVRRVGSEVGRGEGCEDVVGRDVDMENGDNWEEVGGEECSTGRGESCELKDPPENGQRNMWEGEDVMQGGGGMGEEACEDDCEGGPENGEEVGEAMELGESEGVGGDKEVGRSESVANKKDSGLSLDNGRREDFSEGEGGEEDKMEEGEDVEGASDLPKLPLGEHLSEKEQGALYRPGFGESASSPSSFHPPLHSPPLNPLSPSPPVPDLSLLEPRLVQLLATQRLQQLFAAATTEIKNTIEGSSPSSSPVQHQPPSPPSTRSINGMRPILIPKPAKPVLTTG